jgi:hypothetical protein
MDALVDILTPLSAPLAVALAGRSPVLALRALQRAFGTGDSEPATILAALRADNPQQATLLTAAEGDYIRSRDDMTAAMAASPPVDTATLIVSRDAIAANDRADARHRQQMSNDRTNAYLAYIITVGFLLTVAVVARYNLAGVDNAVLQTMLGVLGTGWASVITFYYGSSIGSREKNAVLGDTVAVPRKPPVPFPADGGAR